MQLQISFYYNIALRDPILFTKQLTKIPSFLRKFLTSVVWFYAIEIIDSVDTAVDHLKPLLVEFECYYHKFALNI